MTAPGLPATVGARREHLRARDPLTGLPSDLATTRPSRRGEEGRARDAAVVQVDLPELAALDRERGSQVGDELVVQVAGRITRVVRAGDVVCHERRDAFTLLCSGLDGADLEALVDRLRSALTRPFLLADECLEMRPLLRWSAGRWRAGSRPRGTGMPTA